MKFRYLVILGLIISAAVSVNAQTLLGGAEISHKFGFGLNVGAGVEYRSQQWFKHNDQWSAEVSASYKPIKPLKVALGYKFIQSYSLPQIDKKDRKVDPFWSNKHRVSLGVTGEWKPVKILSLSLRERYQYTYRGSLLAPRFDSDGEPAGNKTVDAKSKHILRSRLMAEVKPYKKCRWTPYVSFELYSLLSEDNHTEPGNNDPAKFCDKWRLTVGTDFKINKKNDIGLFYRYADSSDADDNDSPHTIGLTYSFKL